MKEKNYLKHATISLIISYLNLSLILIINNIQKLFPRLAMYLEGVISSEEELMIIACVAILLYLIHLMSCALSVWYLFRELLRLSKLKNNIFNEGTYLKVSNLILLIFSIMLNCIIFLIFLC